MPLMVSTALFSLVRTSPSWSDMGAMASSGFRDMTRLASGDPVMAMGMWRSNREAIIHWLERIMSEMGRYRDMLKDAQDEQLLRVFTEAQVQRDAFIAEPPRRLPEAPLEVDKGKAFLDMLVGGKMADNLRRAEKIPEMMREAPTEKGADAGGKKRLSLADRIAEDVKRDLEKLEKNRNKIEPEREEEH
jgi:prephenate dehydrogenase